MKKKEEVLIVDTPVSFFIGIEGWLVLSDNQASIIIFGFSLNLFRRKIFLAK